MKNTFEKIKYNDYLSFDEMKVIGLLPAIKNISQWKNIDVKRLKRQIKVCMNILIGVEKGHSNFIIDAPTGFGKTILGFMIAEMFSNLEKHLKECHKVSNFSGCYLLTPNKFLQDQYQDDINKFELNKKYAQIKGSSNYKCEEDTTLNFSNRPCSHISISKLSTEKKCGKTCPYVVARKKASQCGISVLNYNYHLTQLNKVFKTTPEFAMFPPRNITVFDESHTLKNIMTDTFSEELKISSIVKDGQDVLGIMEMIYGASRTIGNNQLGFEFTHNGLSSSNSEMLKQQYLLLNDYNYTIIDSVKKYLKNDELKYNIEIYKHLSNVCDIITSIYTVHNDLIERSINSHYRKKGGTSGAIKYDKNDKPIVEFRSKLFKQMSSLKMILDLMTEFGNDILVADIKYVKFSNGKNIQLPYFRFDRLDLLCKKYLFPFTNYTFMMSATNGDSVFELKEFSKELGVENSYIIRNESDFDFSNSPIYTIEDPLPMSFKNKDENFPKMLKRIRDIIRNYPKKAGLIHTGSYEFQNRLKSYLESNNLIDRFIFCTNTKEKKDGVRQIKWDIEKCGWSNRVLVGASLIEGVDLKGELCEFMMFMKVPYASMGDALVRRKMSNNKYWYNLQTMIQLLQGIGRGIRFKDDWCDIYLLDGSFQWFFHKYLKIPSIIKNRLRSTRMSGLIQYDIDIEENQQPPNSPPLPNIEVITDFSKLKPVKIFEGIDIENSEDVQGVGFELDEILID